MKNFKLIRTSEKHLMVTFSADVGRKAKHFTMLLSEDGFAEFVKLELKERDAIPEEWVEDCTEISVGHHGQVSYNKAV